MICEVAEQVQTLPLTFPLYTLDSEVGDTNHCPLALEVNQSNGETYAILFTSEEAVNLYCYRRNMKSGRKVIRDAGELLRIGQQLLTQFQFVSSLAIDPPGGAGPIHFAKIADILFAARDVRFSKRNG